MSTNKIFYLPLLSSRCLSLSLFDLPFFSFFYGRVIVRQNDRIIPIYSANRPTQLAQLQLWTLLTYAHRHHTVFEQHTVSNITRWNVDDLVFNVYRFTPSHGITIYICFFFSPFFFIIFQLKISLVFIVFVFFFFFKSNNGLNRIRDFSNHGCYY